MIGEAVDTAITLGWALAGHDSVAVPVYLAMVVAVAALLCGHQGQPWPLTGLRRRLTPSQPQEDVQAPVCGPQSPSRLPRQPPRRSQRRTAALRAFRAVLGPHRALHLRGGSMNATVILLAGARHLTDPSIVPITLYDIAINIAEGAVIVRHGACPGENSADQTASDWINSFGNHHGVLEDPMPADWDHCAPNCPAEPGHRRRKRRGDTAHPGLLPDYCPGAGPRRNARMTTKLPKADYMLAFPEPGQPNYGTRNCMRLAEQAGIPVRRYTA